jgi:hypothetical protein
MSSKQEKNILLKKNLKGIQFLKQINKKLGAAASALESLKKKVM